MCEVLISLVNIISRAHTLPVCLHLHSHILFLLFHALSIFPGQSFVPIPFWLTWSAFEVSWSLSDYSNPAKPSEVFFKSRHSPQTPGRALPSMPLYSCLFDHWFPQLTWSFQGHSFCLFLSASTGTGWLKLRSCLQMTWQRTILAGP